MVHLTDHCHSLTISILSTPRYVALLSHFAYLKLGIPSLRRFSRLLNKSLGKKKCLNCCCISQNLPTLTQANIKARNQNICKMHFLQGIKLWKGTHTT